MLTIPCPEEVVISAELSSGLGRRLPCANVRSWSRKKTGLTCPEITDERLKEGSTKNKKCSGQSVACEESQGEKKLTLEELKKLSLLDIKSSKPLLDQEIWTKKLLFNCGRIFSNLWTFLKCRKLLK